MAGCACKYIKHQINAKHMQMVCSYACQCSQRKCVILFVYTYYIHTDTIVHIFFLTLTHTDSYKL